MPDILTIKWATGDLHTQPIFLQEEKKIQPRNSSMTISGSARLRERKKSPPTSQQTASCVVSKRSITKKFGPSRWVSSCESTFHDDLWRSVKEKIAARTSMRQIGVGSFGGAEALVVLPLLLHNEWIAGSLNESLSRIKVNEKNCFGMIEWKVVREAASRFLSKHTAAAAWKHWNVSLVEQEELSPMPKDRDASKNDRAERAAPAMGIGTDQRSVWLGPGPLRRTIQTNSAGGEHVP